MSNPWTWDRSHEGAEGQLPEKPGYFHGLKLAVFWERAVAGLIDYVATAIIVWVVLGFLPEGLRIILLTALWVWNSAFMMSRTTQSFGKRVMGIRMVQVREGVDGHSTITYVPMGTAVARLFLHWLVDWLFTLTLGFWVSPIIGRGRGTFADVICKTVAYRDADTPAAVPARTGMALEWP